MLKRFLSVALTSGVLTIPALGCTLNVDDPEVEQSADDDGTVDEACVTKCDETQTTCVGACSDDSCRATCDTKYDECATKCE